MYSVKCPQIRIFFLCEHGTRVHSTRDDTCSTRDDTCAIGKFPRMPILYTIIYIIHVAHVHFPVAGCAGG
jgi:hypothetical protein